MPIITRRKVLETITDSLPAILVFALLMYDPPSREAVPWVAKAYSPLMLWGFIKKVDEDSRIFGIPFRFSIMSTPNRPSSFLYQAALLGMTLILAFWPFG
jgi:hypothetical protein